MTAEAMTAYQLSELIKQQLLSEGLSWQKSFTDGFTMGDPDITVSGVAVTFKPTLDVLKRSAARGLNLVISHEAAFWEAFDPSQIMREDPTRLAKKKFVQDHDMVVWRMHDHMHRMQPEPIFSGLLRKLEWMPYVNSGPGLPHLDIPEIRLDQLASYIQDKLETRNVSVVGDPSMLVRSVGFGVHVLSTILPALWASDVAIVGETAEYDTYEYMRDAVALGEHKGLIRIGHERLEEWGVEQFADWLRSHDTGAPVEWISTGDPFTVPRVTLGKRGR